MATNIMDCINSSARVRPAAASLTNWSGPHSDVALYAAGNTGSRARVGLDLGDSIAEVPTDVLNTGSALGSDELDLT